MKRKYSEIEDFEITESDLNEINNFITKWFNDKNIKIVEDM